MEEELPLQRRLLEIIGCDEKNSCQIVDEDLKLQVFSSCVNCGNSVEEQENFYPLPLSAVPSPTSWVCLSCHLSLHFPFILPRYELLQLRRMQLDIQYGFNVNLPTAASLTATTSCLLGVFLDAHDLTNNFQRRLVPRQFYYNVSFNGADVSLEGSHHFIVQLNELSHFQNILKFECLSLSEGNCFSPQSLMFVLFLATQVKVDEYIKSYFDKRLLTVLLRESELQIINIQQEKFKSQSSDQCNTASPHILLKVRNFHKKHPFMYSDKEVSKMSQEAVIQYPATSYHHEFDIFDVRDYCEKNSRSLEPQWLCPICNSHKLFLKEIHMELALYMTIHTQILNDSRIPKKLEVAIMNEQQKISLRAAKKNKRTDVLIDSNCNDSNDNLAGQELVEWQQKLLDDISQDRSVLIVNKIQDNGMNGSASSKLQPSASSQSLLTRWFTPSKAKSLEIERSLSNQKNVKSKSLEDFNSFSQDSKASNKPVSQKYSKETFNMKNFSKSQPPEFVEICKRKNVEPRRILKPIVCASTRSNNVNKEIQSESGCNREVVEAQQVEVYSRGKYIAADAVENIQIAIKEVEVVTTVSSALVAVSSNTETESKPRFDAILKATSPISSFCCSDTQVSECLSESCFIPYEKSFLRSPLETRMLVGCSSTSSLQKVISILENEFIQSKINDGQLGYSLRNMELCTRLFWSLFNDQVLLKTSLILDLFGRENIDLGEFRKLSERIQRNPSTRVLFGELFLKIEKRHPHNEAFFFSFLEWTAEQLADYPKMKEQTTLATYAKLIECIIGMTFFERSSDFLEVTEERLFKYLRFKANKLDTSVFKQAINICLPDKYLTNIKKLLTEAENMQIENEQ